MTGIVRPAAEDRRQLALVVGREMDDDDVAPRPRSGERREEVLQRFDAAGGGADAADGHARSGIWFGHSLPVRSARSSTGTVTKTDVPWPGAASMRNLASNQPRPFAHADQPKTLMRRRISGPWSEALAVVFDHDRGYRVARTVNSTLTCVARACFCTLCSASWTMR